ncbi:MAG: hypothetical protein A2904_02240 [Candidatus Staskawiczbacteria bacterium RIFCSPLOWO2_01_FULL_33_9]|uniref:Uncharacterized protein n=1 Tax=Candidatus Staskawiczbacteria bacterium RIFCSPLOWO2_01_FULL_33_9 TaxID=1802211 RepID=A0A1G2I9W2_9BACT|nr:MAG: hypothetical protein A2904_02240 [Candidatus Staskawiczbacteria bacterium RIFCSPLOWO2_01_FULL_33_9]
MENSERENIIIMWFLWQFYEMPKFLFSCWKGYLLFGLDYFSIHLLLKTLFSPWRRYNWLYPKGFDIKEFFNTLISNTFSRILGAMCRVVLIIIGITAQIFIFIAGIVIILLWFLLPFIIIFCILFLLTL